MRFLPAVFAISLSLAVPLVASDLPTVKAVLPDIATAHGATLPGIDLRDHFEITGIQGQVVQFRTSLGTFNVEMLPAAAPASVANFLSYVNGARYADTFIHRSDRGLGVIQGGGYAITNPSPLSVDRIATNPPIVLEYNLPNTRGTIAMARTSVLNSATSEWFINTVDNSATLGAANNGGYAVFGRVTGTGMTVVDAIHAVPVYNAGSPFTQLPLVGYVSGAVAASNFVMLDGSEAVPIFPAAAGQHSVASFSVTNTDPELVAATVSGSTLNLALFPGEVGIADLTVTATDSNGNAVANSFRMTVTGGAPEIAIEQPVGSQLADGGSRAFPVVNLGSAADMTFTIKNLGDANLRLTGTPKVAVEGADAAMFSVIAQPASPVAASGGSATFTVRFTPASSGAKTAVLRIASNDGDEAAFAVVLTGAGNALPSLQLPASPLVAEATSADGAAVAFVAAASDAEDGALTPAASPESGGIFGIGDTTVNVSATDSNGAQASGSFVVRVRDTTAPAVTPPADLRVEPEDAAGAVVNFPPAMATDAVGVASLTYSAASGSVFPLGETTVTVTARDAANNTTIRTFTVAVTYLRPIATALTAEVRSGQPAPDAGMGALPGGTVLGTFGTPALGDFRRLAARVTMLAGKVKPAGILVEDGAGTRSLAAYSGGPVPGISAAGVSFKAFFDPLVAPDGSVAFAAAMQGGGVKGTDDDGVWTNTFGAQFALALREGADVPGLPAGAKLKRVLSLSVRDGELLALIALSAAKGVVTAGDDTVLLRMTDAGTATVLLREGRELDGVPGSKIKSFSALSPALGSPGHGRWHGDGVIVAKVVLFDGRTLVVKIAPGGAVTPLLSTGDFATPVDPLARWKTFGLPVASSGGGYFAVAATLQQKLGGVLAVNDGALLFSGGGAAWDVLAREGAAAPVTPAGPFYASFFDPLVNDAGQVAFLATLQGPGVKAANKTALFRGMPGNLAAVARLGSAAPDESGAPGSAVWSKFISCALPSGPGAGVIFLAETSGGDTTAKNKLGLWVVDSQGVLRRLLRTGSTLPGGASPLTKLALLNAVPGALGATRSFNATGSIALLATCADKSQALLRLDIP